MILLLLEQPGGNRELQRELHGERQEMRGLCKEMQWLHLMMRRMHCSVQTSGKSEKSKFAMQNAGLKVEIKLLVWLIVLHSEICKSKLVGPRESRTYLFFKV